MILVHFCTCIDTDGSIKFTKVKEKRHSGWIGYGGSRVLRASGKHSQKKRYKEYTVKGQKTLGYGSDALQVEVKASDDVVKRNRIKVIVVEGDTDDGRATKRAEWEASRSAGEGARSEYTVHGWRDDDALLWMPGHLIYVADPMLHLDQDMAIESVTFTQDDNGTISKLSLVDPRALGGKKPGKTKSNKGLWGAPETDIDVDQIINKALGT